MIVADANLIIYLLHDTPFTALARAVHAKDNDWVVPDLWQAEVLNGLLREVRAGILSLQNATLAADYAADLLEKQVRPCDHRLVLRIAEETDLTAYDACYVALARTLHIKLVTEDRKIQKACPAMALSMKAFLDQEDTSAGLHEKPLAYRVRSKRAK
jgi:predicted nucleic acid-binding protein